MSVTSLTMRGVFPSEMKNQEQNYGPYVADDESPIDLSKKTPAINKQRQSESINEKQYQEEYIRGDSPALSEEENEKRCEFFHTIQKMSALALPPFLHPWLMVNPKELARVGANFGLPNNTLHGVSGYQAYNAPNPYVLNPLSLASLYPLVSEQCGVQYGMTNYRSRAHTEPLSSSLISRTPHDTTSQSSIGVPKTDRNWYYDRDGTKILTETYREVRITESPEKVEVRESRNCYPEDGHTHSRCSSTPPDTDCGNRRKILNIRHLRENWKSDSKLLTSKVAKSQHTSKSRFASDGSLDNAILKLHFAKKKCPANPNLPDKKIKPSSNSALTSIRRSHSCSDLSQFKHSASKDLTRRRYHSGCASDNETFHNSLFSSSQCSLYSVSSKKDSTTDLGAYKRKSYAPSDDSDVESEKSLQSFGSESPPAKKLFQNAKRLKDLRSLSEPSIRKQISPSNGDYAIPTDLSKKSSVPLGKNPCSPLHLNHSPQTAVPWNVYGYYNHLLQRFRDQEILKRHSSYSHDHYKEQYPVVGSEAGLSPPPSPSPENYSPLASSGGWMESSRSGDYGRDESPDSSILVGDPNRKRPCRALTGKHVKHGTGASPSTLITLRQKIQERQKAKELGIAFDKGESGAVKSKAAQNKKSHPPRSNSSKRERSKQGTKLQPSTSLQSKDQSL